MKKVMLKNGKELTLRRAVKEDADKMVEYMTHIGGESDFLTFGTGELQFSIEKQTAFIEGVSSKSNSIMAVALIDNEIVSISNISGGERNRLRHVGDLGISVRKAYWELGIGNAAMEFLIDWAKDSKVIRKINLKVRTDNHNAIKLYKKYGFTEEGVLTRDMCIDGNFFDCMIMGLKID